MRDEFQSQAFVYELRIEANGHMAQADAAESYAERCKQISPDFADYLRKRADWCRKLAADAMALADSL